MEWRLAADAPIYSQLAEQMRLSIVSGEYAPGERLPPVRELALSAGVNPNTMQRAMTELEREGLVFPAAHSRTVCNRGRGADSAGPPGDCARKG